MDGPGGPGEWLLAPLRNLYIKPLGCVQTRGLKDILDRTSEDDARAIEEVNAFDAQLFSQPAWNSCLTGPDPLGVDLGQYGAPLVKSHLCQIFLRQVDPLFKVLHGPSLSAYLIEGKQYFDYEPGHPATEALAAAVYYAAACSLTEEQCLSIFGVKKEPVVARYRLASETSLIKAGFVTTNDLTVLQAYVLYLVSFLPMPWSASNAFMLTV